MLKSRAHLHSHGRLQVQTLPMNARSPVEQLRHKGSVVEVSLSRDVARPDKRSQPDALGSRDDHTCAAELRPFLILIGPIALFALEFVVKFLKVDGIAAGGTVNGEVE